MIDLPPLSSNPGQRGHFVEFFEEIVSKHTERAYLAAARDFAAWCAENDIDDLEQINAATLRGFLAMCTTRYAPSTAKQRALCLRCLLESTRDFQCPAGDAFHGLSLPKSKPPARHVSRISEAELGRLLQVHGASLVDLRDRALLALLITCFVPIRALCRLTTKTFLRDKDGPWLRLGKRLDQAKYLCPEHVTRAIESYLSAAVIKRQEDPYLFRSIAGASGALTGRPLSQADVFRIVRRRAKAAGIKGLVSPRELRAAGIARFLSHGRRDLEIAADLAGHISTRSTIRYTPPGATRPRRRIAYRLSELDKWDLFEDR